MKIRALIVDDMPTSRMRVRRCLDAERGVEIVGECPDGFAALDEVARLRPDLLLLDVQMPGMSGLELLARLPREGRPEVVFVTAFAEFAVQAFAAEAVDYLVKPLDRERLRQALVKVRARLADRAQAAAKPAAFLDRIAVKSVGRVEFVAAAAIDWIETAGNYLSLHCGKDAHLVRETMSRIESQLDPKVFVRIHRSAMVRIEAIRTIEPLFNGDRSVTLRDGSKLTLSRSYRDKVRAVLGDI